MMQEAERDGGDPQRSFDVLDPPRVESEFFAQLQELRDRIRMWEAANGDGESRSRPS